MQSPVVARGRRVADIRTGEVIAVLALEHAIEHEKLLAAAMRVL